MKCRFILGSIFLFLGLHMLVAADVEGDVLATQNGAPVANQRNSETCGNNRGPLLLEDQLLVERLAIQNRERIPERAVHARGTVAKGFFELTNPISEYTYADLFNGEVGKRTPVAVRFSTVVHSKGSPEFLRDPRGFAVKFYTQDGNWDLVGNNFPVFFIRDPIQFPEMVRAFKPNPVSGVASWWRPMDFFSHVPESVHMFTFLLDDMGIPEGYQYMNGSGVHTFVFVNSTNHGTLVRFTWKSLQGVKSLLDEEATNQTFSFATLSLYNAIKQGNFPQWELYIQTLPMDVNVSSLSFDPLDTTKEWPTYGPEEIKQIKIGVLTLDQNIKNHHLENEQITLSPGRLVPGIKASNERMLQGRLFSYSDTQRYRVGVNSNLIPINKAVSNVKQANQDGALNVFSPDNLLNPSVNYFPSELSTTHEASKIEYPEFGDQVIEGNQKIREPFPANKDDFIQAGNRYRSFDSARQERFALRVASTLSDAELQGTSVIETWLGYWNNVDTGLANKIRNLLGLKKRGGKLAEEFEMFRRSFLKASGTQGA